MITNRGKRYYSLRGYKSGQGFQIGPNRFQIGAEITNWGKKDFKSGQGLQIGAEQLFIIVSHFFVEHLNNTFEITFSCTLVVA